MTFLLTNIYCECKCKGIYVLELQHTLELNSIDLSRDQI